MTKVDIIEVLVECYRDDKEGLKEMELEELEARFDGFMDDSYMFTNGSDDWDEL